MNLMNPVKTFREFYSNPIIRELGAKERWTVVDSELIPIHMPHLLDSGDVRAVSEISGTYLVSLPDLTDYLPQAANCSMFLSLSDGVSAVLVDHTAPAEVMRELLLTPSGYAEYAMDGRGILLLIRRPETLFDVSQIHGTATLKAHNESLKMIVQGWVTLSRNVLPQGKANLVRSTGSSASFWGEYLSSLELLASHHEDAALDAQAPVLTGFVDLMTRHPLQTQISDAQGDVAAFEYSALGELYRRLIPSARNLWNGPRLTHTSEAYLLYNAATRLLPHRSKYQRLIEPALFDAARETLIQQGLLKLPPKRRSR